MNLKEFLEISGMTQKNMAKRSKVTQSTIFKILNGNDVKLSTAMRLCEASKNMITPHSLYQHFLSAKNKIRNSEDKNHQDLKS